MQTATVGLHGNERAHARLAAGVLAVAAGWSGCAVAGTSANATHGNTIPLTAQTIYETPSLVLRQNLTNTTPAAAQSVSPQYFASTILGSIEKKHPREYYSFAVT